MTVGSIGEAALARATVIASRYPFSGPFELRSAILHATIRLFIQFTQPVALDCMPLHAVPLPPYPTPQRRMLGIGLEYYSYLTIITNFGIIVRLY